MLILKLQQTDRVTVKPRDDVYLSLSERALPPEQLDQEKLIRLASIGRSLLTTPVQIQIIETGKRVRLGFVGQGFDGKDCPIDAGIRIIRPC